MGPIQTIDDLLGLLWRRRFLIGAIVALGMLVSVMVALGRPKVYETGAVIQVESPVVSSTPGAAPTPGVRSAQILQAVEQRLTTRENLIAIIERHGLFADAPGLSLDQKVAALRASIGFQSVASVSQQSFGTPSSVSALIITARFADGEQAARVANDFAQGILDQSSATQSERARETLAFFQQEEQRVATAIAALEAEIAAYNSQNTDAALGTAEASRDALASLETEMRTLDQSLAGFLGERGAIEKKQTLRETDRRRLEDLSAQIAVVESQKAALETRRADLTAALTRGPEVTRDLAAFDRNLTQLQAQHDVVIARLAEAETNLRLEELQHSEHFSLLERAIVPEYPMGGGGKKLALMGTVAATLLALGLAFLLDLLHPAIRTSAQMQRELDITPVVTIPDLPLPRGRHKPRLADTAAMAVRLVPLPVAERIGALNAGPDGVLEQIAAQITALPRAALLGAGAFIFVALVVAVA